MHTSSSAIKTGISKHLNFEDLERTRVFKNIALDRKLNWDHVTLIIFLLNSEIICDSIALRFILERFSSRITQGSKVTAVTKSGPQSFGLVINF